MYRQHTQEVNQKIAYHTGEAQRAQQQEIREKHINEITRLNNLLTRWNTATEQSDYQSLALQMLIYEGFSRQMIQPQLINQRTLQIQRELEEQNFQRACKLFCVTANPITLAVYPRIQ